MAKKYSLALAANVLTDLTGGGVAAANAGTFFLALCNRETVDRKVRIAITTGAAVTTADYVNFDRTIEGNGELSRWPVPLAAGWKVFVQADGTGISATLIGLEEV